jgi:hypothetical protein
MTSEMNTLLGQLQEAIEEAISESGRVNDLIAQMRHCGYDLCLMLESTVTISPTGDRQSDGVPEPRLASNVSSKVSSNATSDVSASNGEITLTAEDREFLQELNIAA